MMKMVCMVPCAPGTTLPRRTGEESGDMIAEADGRGLVAAAVVAALAALGTIGGPLLRLALGAGLAARLGTRLAAVLGTRLAAVLGAQLDRLLGRHVRPRFAAPG